MIRVSKFRRPGGRWYVRYWVCGKPVDESARTKSEAIAERYRLRRDMEINAGIQPIKHAEMGQLIVRFLDSLPPGISDSHRHEATRILHGFLRICGRKRRRVGFQLRTEQLSPELVDRYINRRQSVDLHQGERLDSLGRRIVRRRAISNVTLRKELRYLSRFFNWCCRQRPPYLRENPIPLSNANLVKDDRKPHFMITDEEFRALLRVLCETP